MKTLRFLTIAAPILLIGCTTDSQTPPPASAPLMDQSVPQVARDACLREVARVTNTPPGVIVGLDFSQANSQVTIGVGPQLAKWQCTVSNSGIVAGVESLTDEGAL